MKWIILFLFLLISSCSTEIVEPEQKYYCDIQLMNVNIDFNQHVYTTIIRTEQGMKEFEIQNTVADQYGGTRTCKCYLEEVK